ncbi:MAG: hypothetical protein Kow0059_15070 [Candidatus Sumerlaeia bacterium]
MSGGVIVMSAVWKGKKAAEALSRWIRGKDDLPGMLLFSAALLALIVLMGWATQTRAATVEKDRPVHAVVSNSPEPASDSTSAPCPMEW